MNSNQTFEELFGACKIVLPSRNKPVKDSEKTFQQIAEFAAKEVLSRYLENPDDEDLITEVVNLIGFKFGSIDMSTKCQCAMKALEICDDIRESIMIQGERKAMEEHDQKHTDEMEKLLRDAEIAEENKLLEAMARREDFEAHHQVERTRLEQKESIQAIGIIKSGLSKRQRRRARRKANKTAA